jgi:hypothetical protein
MSTLEDIKEVKRLLRNLDSSVKTIKGEVTLYIKERRVQLYLALAYLEHQLNQEEPKLYKKYIRNTLNRKGLTYFSPPLGVKKDKKPLNIEGKGCNTIWSSKPFL